ncbi:MAG: ATP-binding protein [Anaerolineales bacterium]
MQFITKLFDDLAYLNPIQIAGWLVWLGFAGLLAVALMNWRGYHPAWNQRSWGILAALLFLTPLTALFLGVKFSTGSTLPVPGMPEEASGSTMMLFSAIPWTLAGGLLGPFAAAGVGMLSGLLRGVWDTHSLFSVVDLGLMAVLFSVANRQRYRTPIFRALRMPLVSALALIVPHAIFFVLSSLFTVTSSATMTERLDYALSNVGMVSLAFGGEMLLAGLFAQVIALVFKSHWGELGMLQPSPAEKSIETRFISGTGTVISLLLVTLLLGDWIVAGAKARDLLHDRLESTAHTAAQSVPFFLETGQNLASRLAADSELSETADSELPVYLSERIQSIPYFNQLIVFDTASVSLVASYPPEMPVQLTQQEEAGLQFIQQGVPNQVYAIPPLQTGEAARISFFAAIPGTTRVLVARTDLESNPYTRALIENLNSMQELNGAGLLVDDQGTILYHPQTDQIMSSYTGQRSDTPSFFDETASIGTRQLVYYQPVTGHPWAVVLTIPAQETQQVAIDIAFPISLMIILLGLVALISLRLSLRTVTGSLQNLAAETKHIAQGKFDRPLTTDGVDELADLRRAFEQMRVSLQGRLDELNRLLSASQGVASSLTLKDALQPVLEAVVASGASAARIILVRDMLPSPVETPHRFSHGPEKDLYMHLDQQVLSLAEQQDKVVMAVISRTRLTLDPGLPHPKSLIAIALRHENKYYGVLWAAYREQHIFNESDLRFMSTLASQSSLAVANISLFMKVEVSRRQLEAILDSTPDPVLVTDASDRLILANPAAVYVFNVVIRRGERSDLERTIQIKELNELLTASSSERRSAEIRMPDGKTYLAMASPMSADGKTVGRVCILRDVTQLKEIDTLKSDFVSTVSHDLRSPLTLMRGYATMLEMAGTLNDQQKNYVKMIVQGVDNMAKLVNNLLDLGRIDFGVGLQLENIPVLDIIERVTGALQLQAKQKSILLGVEIPKNLPHAIEADQALLHQALYNLVENALKYTPDGGEVTIDLQADDSCLTFAVKDSGIGIPATDLPRLFEKFYRGTNREALAKRGTGLGLAIVKSIAERHRGKVWVESELGKGSTFHLQVPLVQTK